MDPQVSAPKYPEEIFPLEVWGMIFDHLESASDVATCFRTCQAWNGLLKSKRNNFLMPEVFPLLAKYLKPNHLQIMIREVLNRDVPPNEIFKLRVVSRFWKESVDSYLRNHPSINDIRLLPKKYGNDDTRFLRNKYNFSINGCSPRSFITKFPLDSNPFISRYIKYTESFTASSDLITGLRVDFKELLESFGSQIWSCYLKLFCRTKEDFIMLPQHLRMFLSLMPNLRILKLKLTSFSYNSPKQSILETKPFPQMKQLRVLEMIEVPYSISAGILVQSKELRKFSFQAAAYERKIQGPILDAELPNLEHLILPKCSEVEMGWLNNRPLQILELAIPCDEKVDNIFQTLEMFGNTLENLFIVLDDAHDNNKMLQKLRLKLPKLKQIKLSVPFHLKTVDFIAECKELKEIELDVALQKGIFFGKKDAAISVIKFYMQMPCMQQSNIWQVLPILKCINVRTTTLGLPMLRNIWNILIRQQEKWVSTHLYRRGQQQCSKELKTFQYVGPR